MLTQFGTSGNDYAKGIAVDKDGYVFTSGYTSGAFGSFTNAGEYDGFLLKFDGAGVLLWTKQFGTVGTDYVYGIAVDNTGNSYVGGTTTAAFAGQTNAALGPPNPFANDYLEA